MTDIATTQTLTSPQATPMWDHRIARAERLDALNAELAEHRRQLAKPDGPRWLLGMSLLALGGGL